MQGFRSSWVNRPSRPVTEQSHHSFIDNVADLSHLVVAEGAKIPLKLAFGDIQGVSGAYWANDSISSTDDGKVQEW
jgi:hypothetical protein